MGIKITHKVEHFCDECGKTVIKETVIPEGGIYPNVSVLEGWNFIHGYLYCPNHTVTYVVDGISKK